MKAIRFSILPLALTAALAVRAQAIEAPDDNAPPPPPPAGAEAPPPAEAQVPQAPAADAPAFLGVGGIPVPELLSVHLNLKPGEGVVVRTLMPDGPAAKAGIAVNDVIIRVGGEPVTSQDDLAMAVQKHKPGEKIAIDFIHEGKPGTKDATLAARPAGLQMPQVDEIDRLRLQGMPDDLAARVRRMMEQQQRLFQDPDGALQGPDAPAPPQGIHDAMDRMQRQLRDLQLDGQNNIQGQARILGNASFKMMDAEGSVEMNNRGQGKEATVRDKGGKVLWSGPWETEQDRAAAPPDIRDRLNRLNIDPAFKGQGLRLRMGGGLGGGVPFQEPDPFKDEDEAEQDADKGGAPGPKAPEAPPGGPME